MRLNAKLVPFGLAALALVTAGPTRAGFIQVVPQSQSILPGDVIPVQVILDTEGGARFSAIDFTITWDSTAFKLIDGTYRVNAEGQSSPVSTPLLAGFTGVNNPMAGSAIVSYSRATNLALTGSGWVLEFSLKASNSLAAGEYLLNLVPYSGLSDDQGNEVPFSREATEGYDQGVDGLLTHKPAALVPEPSSLTLACFAATAIGLALHQRRL